MKQSPPTDFWEDKHYHLLRKPHVRAESMYLCTTGFIKRTCDFHKNMRKYLRVTYATHAS